MLGGVQYSVEGGEGGRGKDCVLLAEKSLSSWLHFRTFYSFYIFAVIFQIVKAKKPGQAQETSFKQYKSSFLHKKPYIYQLKINMHMCIKGRNAQLPVFLPSCSRGRGGEAAKLS